MSQAALARQLDLPSIIEQIANGAYLRDIARATGIDKRRISEALRQHPEYAFAKECAIECQLDAAEEALASADSDIARAREIWRAATWRAEREAPHRWGQRSQVDHQGLAIQVVIGIERDLGRARVVVDTDQSHAAIPGGIVVEPQRDDPPA